MDEEQDSSVNKTDSSRSSSGKIIAIVLALVVIGAVAFFLMSKDSNKSSNNNETASNTGNNTKNLTTGSDLAGPPTKEQVALHNQKSDCWTIVNGKVYDITSYIPRHPGGDEILRACGVDGTSLFETRTTADGQKINGGGSHSSTAQNQLKQLEIGTLAN